jgi:hypothetical protein
MDEINDSPFWMFLLVGAFIPSFVFIAFPSVPSGSRPNSLTLSLFAYSFVRFHSICFHTLAL